MVGFRVLRRSSVLLVRSLVIAAAVGAVGWAVMTAPKFWSESALINIAPHILAGEAYKSAALDALLPPQGISSRIPPSALSKIAIVRLRGVEDALAAGAVDGIDSRLDQLRDAIEASLVNAPADPFLWLVMFWLDNTRNGYAPAHLVYLRTSYALGPDEAWIATRRNRLALAIFPALPPDLANAAIAEFAGLVRSRLYAEAANIVAGPGRPLRRTLLAQVANIKETERRYFASLLEARNVDDARPLLGLKSADDPRP
jgi:hypothetical protein